jgi:hypothetical protein
MWWSDGILFIVVDNPNFVAVVNRTSALGTTTLWIRLFARILIVALERGALPWSKITVTKCG